MRLSQQIRRRILKKCALGKPVVIVPKGGRPSRVFDFEKYLNIVQQAKTGKPWTYRSERKPPDPLGAVAGRVLSSLRRKDMYE